MARASHGNKQSVILAYNQSVLHSDTKIYVSTSLCLVITLAILPLSFSSSANGNTVVPGRALQKYPTNKDCYFVIELILRTVK